MRGPACFTNCSPAESQVTVNASTYAIGANEIGWELELFGSGGKTVHSLPAGVSDLSFGIAGALPAKHALKLAYPPVSPNSVQVTLQGTATQRALVGLGGYASEEEGSIMNAHDYFVVGSTVYVTFDLVSTDQVVVRYVAMAGSAASPAGATGVMRYVLAPVSAADEIEVRHWPDVDGEAVFYTTGDANYGLATDGGTAEYFGPATSDDVPVGQYAVADYAEELDPGAAALADAGAAAVALDLQSARVDYVPETGWVKADGVTRYAISRYSALYSYLVDNGALAEGASDTHFSIAPLAVPLGSTANLVLIKA